MMHLKKKNTIEAKNELESFLHEACVNESEDFNVLCTLKMNASRFIVLSKMARDVLIVLMSIVPVEFAFILGSYVLNVFNNSLSPKTTKALIYT